MSGSGGYLYFSNKERGRVRKDGMETTINDEND